MDIANNEWEKIGKKIPFNLLNNTESILYDLDQRIIFLMSNSVMCALIAESNKKHVNHFKMQKIINCMEMIGQKIMRNYTKQILVAK